MQVWLFAPGIFPFLQTKLLAFLLSLYFREAYFYLHLCKVCVQGSIPVVSCHLSQWLLMLLASCQSLTECICVLPLGLISLGDECIQAIWNRSEHLFRRPHLVLFV